MKRIRLFIADADAAFTEKVRTMLHKSPVIEVVGTAFSGAQALELLSAYRPDVLLTDINLPELDGITLLKRARCMREPPACIVCTGFYSELCVEYANRGGASFFLYKPVDFSRLPAIITDCWRCFRSISGDETSDPGVSGAVQGRVDAVRARLRRVGVPSNLTGSLYITEAVLCLSADRRLLNNMKNGLYPQIAARTNSTPQRIERAIRCAVSAAYERGSLKRHFAEKPTNRSFLEIILRSVDQPDEKAIPLPSPAFCE